MIDIRRTAMAHARHLAGHIGQRTSGSPANEAAAGYVAGVFAAAGLAVERQAFACPRWAHQETVLELAGHRLEATANWCSPVCDVTAPLVPAGSLEELERAELAGAIVLLHGELAREELNNRSDVVWYPPLHRQINDLLDRKRPATVLAVSPDPRWLQHLIVDPDMPFPSATVSRRAGLELLRHADEQVHLRIAATRSSGQCCNVLGRRPGPGAERIVISAHYDTVWGSPGAVDNASGVAVMLALAQMLAGRGLRVGLEFFADGAEEFTGLGPGAYLEAAGLQPMPAIRATPVGERSQVWQPILAAINIDGVGVAQGANSVTAIAGSEAFTSLVQSVRAERHPGVVWVDPWPASDQYTFYSHGVPSVALSFTGVRRGIHHRPIDTLRQLSRTKLAEAVLFVADLVDALQDKTAGWSRPPEP